MIPPSDLCRLCIKISIPAYSLQPEVLPLPADHPAAALQGFIASLLEGSVAGWIARVNDPAPLEAELLVDDVPARMVVADG